MDASPINFIPRADGGEIAMLGDREVGLVWPWPYSPDKRAFWTIALPPTTKRQRPAYGVRNAKRELLVEIADWLDGAGFRDHAVKVRGQADQLEVMA